jgi:hypothetical protein
MFVVVSLNEIQETTINFKLRIKRHKQMIGLSFDLVLIQPQTRELNGR